MLWPEKNSFKEFDNEKKFLRLENSPPSPHNFSNGPSLRPRENCYRVFCLFWCCCCYCCFPYHSNYRMSEINIRGFAANQRRPACEMRYTYSSFLLLNSCGMGGLLGLCQKSAKRTNIFVSKNAWRTYFSSYYVDLWNTTRDTVTTARADLETGLTNDRVANWPPEVAFSPLRRLRVIIGCWVVSAKSAYLARKNSCRKG